MQGRNVIKPLTHFERNNELIIFAIQKVKNKRQLTRKQTTNVENQKHTNITNIFLTIAIHQILHEQTLS